MANPVFSAGLEFPTNLVMNFSNFPSKGEALLKATMLSLAARLQSKIKNEKLQGQVLKYKSGKLSRSIKYNVQGSGRSITATVFSTGVPYAAIHEYGGRTKPHLIFPKKSWADGGVLAFKMNGKMVFSRYVMHPGSKIPMRSYLRSSLKEMEPEIRSNLLAAIVNELKHGRG